MVHKLVIPPAPKVAQNSAGEGQNVDSLSGMVPTGACVSSPPELNRAMGNFYFYLFLPFSIFVDFIGSLLS